MIVQKVISKKTLKKNFFVGILSATDENIRILDCSKRWLWLRCRISHSRTAHMFGNIKKGWIRSRRIRGIFARSGLIRIQILKKILRPQETSYFMSKNLIKNIVLFGETVLVKFQYMLADKNFEVGRKIRIRSKIKFRILIPSFGRRKTGIAKL